MLNARDEVLPATSFLGRMTSCLDCSVRHPHSWAIQSGLSVTIFHSEVAAVLLDECVLPLTLSICLQVLGWHPNDVYQNNIKLGLSDTTYTCAASITTRFLIHLPDYKANIWAVCTCGQDPDRMHYSFCFLCSPTTVRSSDQKTSKLQQRNAFK